MSGSWETFLEILNEDKYAETNWQTEICDCKDGSCQLFYNNVDKGFTKAGNCDVNKLCARIMRDKHQAKVSSRKFKEHEKIQAITKKNAGTQCKIYAPTSSSSRSKPGKKAQKRNFTALTAFF